MKNIRHNTIRNTAIAIVALAGLAVATTACFGNSSADSASKALDATIEAVADQPESAAKDESPRSTSSVTTEVESPAPSTATPSTATPSTATPSTAAPASPEATEAPETEAAPSTEAPATTTPSTTAPSTTTPSTPSTPTLVMSPTIHFVTFANDSLNISSSILVEEGGAGRNDIVSVEMSYTKFGVAHTVAATQASSTTTASLWLIDGLMLRVGDTVTIHAVDARGNSDDMTATVALTTSMG